MNACRAIYGMMGIFRAFPSHYCDGLVSGCPSIIARKSRAMPWLVGSYTSATEKGGLHIKGGVNVINIDRSADAHGICVRRILRYSHLETYRPGVLHAKQNKTTVNPYKA